MTWRQVEANPVQAILEAEPGGQAVVFRRCFQPARQEPALDKELPQTKMVYELSMKLKP